MPPPERELRLRHAQRIRWRLAATPTFLLLPALFCTLPGHAAGQGAGESPGPAIGQAAGQDPGSAIEQAAGQDLDRDIGQEAGPPAGVDTVDLPVRLGGTWRTRAGGDVAGADTGLDDSLWATVDPGTGWSEQGRVGFDGVVWYRRWVYFDPPPAGSELALLVGPVVYGGFDLYADGERIGGVAPEGRTVPLPDDHLFTVPPASAQDGALLVAIRVQRIGWISDAVPSGRPAVGGVLLGSRPVMELVAENRASGARMAALATLLFSIVAFVVGFYHVLLFAQRRSAVSYLWFGLASLAFGVNALGFSPWSAPWLQSLGGAYRITDASGHLAAAFLVPFLWGILDRPMSPAVRGYGLSHVALAALVVVVPFPWIVHTSMARFVWLVPFLVTAVGLLIRDARDGNPEARVLLGGALFLAAGEVAEALRVAGLPLPHSLPYVGFAGLLFFIAGALARRFARAHRELDALRVGLEGEVARRTAELEEMTREARSLSDAKGRLVSTLSHELRAPLKSITGFSSVLLTEPDATLDEEQMDFLERIRSSAHYALTLVSNLLDMSRIETGRLHIDPEELDVGALVRDTCAELEGQAEARAVDFSAEVPEGLDTIRSDGLRLKQVLVNVVGNAFKYAPRGRVRVVVVAEGSRPSAIRVIDSGMGIPEDLLDAIRQPYRQGPGPPAGGKKDGAGLGLSIADSLCRILGCELHLESTVGAGTTVTVVLGEIPTPGEPPPA